MKVSIGVDAGSGYIHSIETSSANVHDITVASQLLRDDDSVVYGDSGYLGLKKREEIRTDEKFSRIDYRINRRRGRERGQNFRKLGKDILKGKNHQCEAKLSIPS